MTVAHRKPLEQDPVERDTGGRINRRNAVFLVDRLTQHKPPSAVAPLQKVIEATGADHVGQYALDATALRNRHFGLRHGALGIKIDRDAAEKVQDADALVPTRLR